MSTLDESGVYYSTSLVFPDHHPDQQSGYSPDALKQCSVKGCADTLSISDQNRMCDACRSRHRVYASTKRARRKLEKAAIINAVAARSGKDIQEMSLAQPSQPNTWITKSDQDLQPTTSSPLALSTWNHAIDPRLFSGDISSHHISPLRPHQTSTSSELANALTPRKPSTPVSGPASVVLFNQATTDCSTHRQHSSHLQIASQPQSVASQASDSDDNDEEQQVIASLQGTALQDQHMGELSNLSSSDLRTPSETKKNGQDRSSDEVDGSRFCSVKGCKAVIQASYEYKMCPPCRTRYRTYGNTKRAKWKAERDTFDREMAVLRTVEDEKRKAKGLRPLAESPAELHAWELSVIDEQAPLVLTGNSATLPVAADPGSGLSFPSSSALVPSADPPMVTAGFYPPSVSSSSTVDSPDAISPYPHLNNNPLLAAAANTSLPARMCTVSHCHKILPGYYRYKRCEQHRLQNRHHSQLKRVREKEVKAIAPEEGTALVGIGPEVGARRKTERNKERQKTEQVKGAVMTGGIDKGEEAVSPLSVASPSMTGDVDSEGKRDRSHDPKRSKFSCSAGDCHNLLLPTVRWRSCEPCRSIDRQRKNQIKFEQKTSVEKYYWSEKMKVDPQMATVSENQCAAGANGMNQASQQISHAVSAGTLDPDAEGDIDMSENETDPKAVDNQQPVDAPIVALPPLVPPVPMTSGFSRFHVTIDPRNVSSSAALDPTTSTAKLVTLDDPLAFRAYRPKTTPSAIGRILARNPGLSVDAFTEVLQAEGATADTMALPPQNQANTTKPIITPTIPTSAPFVYKAPEKKNASTKSQEGTTGKGKRKVTSSEKKPTVSIMSATPVPASGVSGSAVPGPYGAYGYPPCPYPYPYYIPSPYAMPPYHYPQHQAPTPSDPKQEPSSKSSTSAADSSSSPTHVPPVPGYSPYPYPYPPQPYGYPAPSGGYTYMPTRYIPGQHPYNGLPPVPPGSPYPYPYYPPVSASPTPASAPPPLAPRLAPTSGSTPSPKISAAARQRQQSRDTKFNYYHYGVGSSDSPTTPNKRKRRKVDPDYLVKLKAKTEAISVSLAMIQAKRDTLSSVSTPLPASAASIETPHVISDQPETTPLAVDAEAVSKPITTTRLCTNKSCHRSLPETANTLCDKCRLRFKKHQAKTKKRFKLEPRKFLLAGKTIGEKARFDG